MDYRRLPIKFGEQTAVRALISRFTRLGGMAEIIRILGAADEVWAEGLNVRKFKPWLDREDPPWMFGGGAALAAQWAAERRFNLTDPQFDAIEDLIEPSVLKRRNGQQTLSKRELMNGILLKLRSGVRWNHMPRPWEGGSDLWRASVALARSGCWIKIVATWREKHPEIVEGLEVEIIERTGASTTRQSQKAADIRKRGSTNCEGIFEKLGELLKTAVEPLGVAVGLLGSRLRLPDHKLLRPDLVAGPAHGVVGPTFTQPDVVAQRAESSRYAKYLNDVRRFRTVRGVRHILLVSTDRVLVEHYEKKDGKWISRTLLENDAIRIEHMGVSVQVRDIYVGAELSISPR